MTTTASLLSTTAAVVPGAPATVVRAAAATFATLFGTPDDGAIAAPGERHAAAAGGKKLPDARADDEKGDDAVTNVAAWMIPLAPALPQVSPITSGQGHVARVAPTALPASDAAPATATPSAAPSPAAALPMLGAATATPTEAAPPSGNAAPTATFTPAPRANPDHAPAGSPVAEPATIAPASGVAATAQQEGSVALAVGQPATPRVVSENAAPAPPASIRPDSAEARPAALRTDAHAPAVPLTPAAQESPVPNAPAAQVFAAAMHRFAEAQAGASHPRDTPAEPVLATAMPLATGVQTTLAVAAATAPDTRLDTAQRHWPEAMIARITALRDASDALAATAAIGSDHARIRLSPDALGSVEVSLQRRDDQVHVTIHAERPQAQALIADAQPRLAELAEQRGIRLQHNGAALDAHAGAGSDQRSQQPPTGGTAPTTNRLAAHTRGEAAGDDRVA